MPVEPNKSSNKQTLVEEGTEFKGTLNSACPVVINGSVDGELNAPELTVTSTGAVLGAIKARKVRSQGTLSGNIEAHEVFISGTVKSNTIIRAKSLEVRLAPERGKLEVTFGECTLDVGDEPVKQDVAEPAKKMGAELAISGPPPLPTGLDAPEALAKPELEGSPNKDKKKDEKRGSKNGGRDSVPPGPL
jgi:cytoskeletal protein CcmA (bactofilin family)